jgi:hypothetical protein
MLCLSESQSPDLPIVAAKDKQLAVQVECAVRAPTNRKRRVGDGAVPVQRHCVQVAHL